MQYFLTYLSDITTTATVICSVFFDFIDLLALVSVDEVTRLNLAKNATYTSPTARNSMLEAIYSVVQVSMSIHCACKLSFMNFNFSFF